MTKIRILIASFMASFLAILVVIALYFRNENFICLDDNVINFSLSIISLLFTIIGILISFAGGKKNLKIDKNEIIHVLYSPKEFIFLMTITPFILVISLFLCLFKEILYIAIYVLFILDIPFLIWLAFPILNFLCISDEEFLRLYVIEKVLGDDDEEKS